MLAQNFMTADDLQITDKQQAALIKALGALERGEAKHVEVDDIVYSRGARTLYGFNMWSFYAEADCGTAGCICGWAEFLGGLEPFSLANARVTNARLDTLFDPPSRLRGTFDMKKITPEQAATALRSYLSTGDANWKEALSSTNRTES